jgi:uncharacterized membrane protein
MAVLFVLFGSCLLYRLLGFAVVPALDSWVVSGRVALATMFLFTATTHFAPMKEDLIAMVPPAFPRPDVLVLLTGLAEIAGAVGLLVPSTTRPAAAGLIVLLAAMLPANISAARRGVRLRGRPVTSLWLRVPMQLLFMAWAWAIR